MKSRVKNVVCLPEQYDNDHGMRQLCASIVCMRLHIEETTADDERRGVALNKKVFEFAREDLDAERLYRIRKIDVFDAAANAGFSANFRNTYPDLKQKLARHRGA
jgi:hypothetical protein